jgi:hypothetical protein
MVATLSPETLVTIYQSQWLHILEDLSLQDDEVVIPTEVPNFLLLLLLVLL